MGVVQVEKEDGHNDPQEVLPASAISDSSSELG